MIYPERKGIEEVETWNEVKSIWRLGWGCIELRASEIRELYNKAVKRGLDFGYDMDFIERELRIG